MTAPTSTTRRRLTVGPVEARQARHLLDDLGGALPDRWEVRSRGGRVEVDRELSELLTSIVESLAAGRTVTLGAVPEVLTTSVAADLLGISRTALMKHVASGALPAHKVGTHTRLRTADVQAFRRARLERQRAAFERLLAVEDELEL